MALGRNYITLNGVSLPNPESWQIKYTNIENVKQSEAGNDLGIVTRLNKRTFSATFNCTSYGADKLKAICSLTTCNLVYRGETIEVRPRLSVDKLQSGSEYLSNTDGLFVVSLALTEV